MKKRAFLLGSSLFSIFSLFMLFQNAGAEEPVLSKGQTVYVPVYSHILVGGGKKQIPFDLSINLSIRNTDPKKNITIIRGDYFDSHGNLVKRAIDHPVVLKPMASTYIYIERSDTSGGWGANYIIQWQSETEVNEPLIESVTYGSRGNHSISFVSRGKVIKD